MKWIGLLAVLLAGCAVNPTPAVVDLRCESKVSPMGIDVGHPLLSWRMESENRGEMQSAYQVKVLSGPAQIWDSGEVKSDQSVDVEYAGPKLESGREYQWNVMVWDQDGKSAVAKPATWEMGLLDASDWQAKWIDSPESEGKGPPRPPATTPSTSPTTARSKRKFYPPNSPPYFRKNFAINKQIARARLYVTAMGLYECEINGQRIGDSVLAPDWTNYHHRVRYQTYDVTNDLRNGDNAIGAILGDGWYSGDVGFVGMHIYGSLPALLAQVVIQYSDGSRETISTDESWKTAMGPILKSDLLDGEDYDAQREFSDWSQPAFDDSNWKPATVRNETPEILASIAPPVRKTSEISAKTVKEPVKGHYVFDLGQNMVGFARLKINADTGRKITLKFAEMLNPDGTIYTDNLRLALVTDTYICKGTGNEIFEPHFTFHGFRYVEVTGSPVPLSTDAITGIVIGSDNEPAGHWECSNPMLNQLQSNIVWGQRGNFVSIPTDCPQRDERLGWMGDAEIFIRTATDNYNVREFFDNWLVEVADAQSKEGAYSDVTPRVGAGEGVAAWADAGVICPWTLYLVYGDKRILSRQYDSMAKFIEYLQAHSEYFIRPAKGYGDWLNINSETPKDVLATAYFAYSTELMSRIAEVLGKQDDSARYQQFFLNIKKAFNENFVGKDGRIQGNTQTVYLIALKFGLLDEDKQNLALKYLLQDIHDRQDHLSTGFVGVSYLLPTLTKYGAVATAYRLLNQDTFPSWLFPVKNGATTIWERWDGWTPDKGFQTPRMNSFNHYSLGSCGEWMFDSVAGIGLDPEHPGFKHIIIHPELGGGLTWAKASYQSPYGLISSDWRVDDDDFKLSVSIPANTTATVYFPDQSKKEIGSGEYIFKSRCTQLNETQK